MRLYPVIKSLHPRFAFRIARGTKTQVDNVFVTLEQDGIVGYGEAAPNHYYGERADDAWEALMGVVDFIKRLKLQNHLDLSNLWQELGEHIPYSCTARCALDLALWDLAGKLQGLTVSEMLWNRRPKPVVTALTLGLSSKNEIKAKLEELRGASIVKIKLGATPDWDFLEAIHSEFPGDIWVDANASWRGRRPSSILSSLALRGVSLLEQPLPPADDTSMGKWIKPRPPSPILIADESLTSLDSLAALPGRFHGINIKLVKCGGLTPALEIHRAARSLGLKIMVGCMLESSLGIAAGAALAQEADFVDLDGSWLLRDDPFEGLKRDGSRLTPSPGPGFGVSPLASYLRI